MADALERGTLGSPGWKGAGARAAAVVWRWTAGVRAVRRLDWPGHVRTVAVGGATLGGSCKTPLAIACAIEIAAAGARVAVVGHAYRGRCLAAQVVAPNAPLDVVGDEAILAARLLERHPGSRVVVGPTRAAAAALAATGADVLVLDGVGQTRPTRATLACLAVEDEEPWGANALPPLGDLRAPIPVLLQAADAVVTIRDRVASGDCMAPPRAFDNAPLDRAVDERLAPPGSGAGGPRAALQRPVIAVESQLEAVWPQVGGNARVVSWAALAAARVGLIVALARPDRVIRALVRRGVRPCAIVRAPDHGPVLTEHLAACASASGCAVDVWLATAKCALHVSAAGARAWPGVRPGDGLAGAFLGAPLVVIEQTLFLPAALRCELRRRALS